MELSEEILTLLREIRDCQREHLALHRAWMEETNRRRDEYSRDADRLMQEHRESRAPYDEANRLYLRQARRGEKALRYFVAFLSIILVALLAVGVYILVAGRAEPT